MENSIRKETIWLYRGEIKLAWNKSFFRRMEADMEKIDNNIQLAFLGGMKAGLEALIHGLEVVAENNNGQVSFEFVKMVSASTIADVELKLSSIENGKGLIDALNNKSEWNEDLVIWKWGRYYMWNVYVPRNVL